jgi:hypothetical protein
MFQRHSQVAVRARLARAVQTPHSTHMNLSLLVPGVTTCTTALIVSNSANMVSVSLEFLAPEIGDPDWDFRVFSSVPLDEIQDITLK